MLDKIIIALAAALIRELTPILVKAVTDEASKILPEITSAIGSEFAKNIPVLVEAAVRAVASGFANFAITTEDKVTDIIPGTLDDEIIDPIVKSVLGALGGLFPK